MGLMTVLTLATSAVSGLGQIAAGNAQAQSSLNQAAAAEYNAKVADMNANLAMHQGKIEQASLASDAARAMARQRAALAQGGILGSVTGDLLEEDSQREYERDQMAVQYKSDIEAAGHRAQSQSLRMNADTYRSNAKAARQGGFWSAGGSLLGGTADAYRQHKYFG